MKKEREKEKFIVIGLSVAVLLLLLCTVFIGQKKYYPFKEDDRTQVLFLGDSNIAYDYEGDSIPVMLETAGYYTAYNGAIGGTSASCINLTGNPDGLTDLFCFYNLAKIIHTGDLQAVLELEDDKTTEDMGKIGMLTDLYLDKMDYLVISYGLNDYTIGCRIEGEDPYDESTYCGALRSGIELLKEDCPNAVIILSSITYCTFAEEGKPFADGYSVNWGGGTIQDYHDAMKKVAEEYEGVVFFDTLESMGVNAENYEIYLKDDIHFNDEGRKLYLDCLMELLKEKENNEG